MIADHLPSQSAPPPVGTPVPGAPQAAPATHSGAIAMDLVNTVLADRYRIIKKLGEGGMGSVYLAEHTTINKKLAIKVLSSEYSHKQDLVDRFLQEARAASMIDQENVVEITDFGSTPNGSVFFVMEYLNGEDLSDTIKSAGKMPWPRVSRIMLQIIDALKSAHEAGIIHRDMKPENCFRLKRGSNPDFIKVLDFGIAKVSSEEGEGGRNLTRTGMIFGTPEYMSPEQAKGEKVDSRVDVYALGVILYELLTGRVPFSADTFMGILTKHMFEPPAAPSTIVPEADIPPEVEAIILKALQKDREYRFQSMEEMGAAIEAVGSGSAAVSVVDEIVNVPVGGETSFKQRAVEFDVDDDEPEKSKAGLFIGLGLAAAVVVAGVGFAAMGGFDDDGSTTSQGNAGPVVEEPRKQPSDEDTAKPENDTSEVKAPIVEPPLAAQTVSITVSTPGVDGTVFDNRDDSELGKTNTALVMPHSTASFDVYVRAEGYEDFLTDVIPDKDKKVEVVLSKLVEPEAPPKKRKRGGRPNRKKGGKATAAATNPPPHPPSTDPPPQKDPPPAGKGKKGKEKDWDTISGDLKNPFGK